MDVTFFHTHLIVVAGGFFVQGLLLLRGLCKQFAVQEILHAVVDLVRATLDRFLFIHIAGG